MYKCFEEITKPEQCTFFGHFCVDIYNAYVVYKTNPITASESLLGLQEVEVPRYQDNRQMKVVRLSALRTCRLYPQGNIPGTHFC